jgi:hypothetical protein
VLFCEQCARQCLPLISNVRPHNRHYSAANSSPTMDSEINRNCKVIDELVDAYNSQDARRFSQLFTEDGWHGNLHADTFQVGPEAIFRRYVEVFAMYPGNRTQVMHRIAFEHFVIDHEKVSRSAESETFDVVAIYTLESGKIKRAELVRK